MHWTKTLKMCWFCKLTGRLLAVWPSGGRICNWSLWLNICHVSTELPSSCLSACLTMRTFWSLFLCLCYCQKYQLIIFTKKSKILFADSYDFFVLSYRMPKNHLTDNPLTERLPNAILRIKGSKMPFCG